MKIKINFNRIIFVISIMALNEPLAMYYLPIHVLFSFGKWVSLFYATYLLVVHIKKINLAIALILIYYVLLLYPSILQGGELRVWFRILYMFVATAIIIHVNMHIDAKFVINTLFTLVTTILFINLIYLGLNGPDMVEGSYGGTGVRYFIGIRTRIGEWAYIGLMLGFVYRYLEPRKAKKRFIILILSILIFTLVNRVTTVIVMLAIFIVLKFLADKKILKLDKLLLAIFYGVLILNILILKFDIQNHFAWFIVDILEEDLTLNSRTVIWESVIQQIKRSPIYGYGVGHIAQFRFRQLFYESLYVSATHNQFLNVLYEAGLIGFIIFITYTRRIIMTFQSYKTNKAYNAIAVGFIIFLVSMTVEISGDNVLYFTLLMIMINFDKLVKEKKNDA